VSPVSASSENDPSKLVEVGACTTWAPTTQLLTVSHLFEHEDDQTDAISSSQQRYALPSTYFVSILTIYRRR
jgi:hypothetical protein